MDAKDLGPMMLAPFREMAAAEAELFRRFGIKDQGQYAARLVAQALGAKERPNGANKGFDLQSLDYGRIEVRSRRLPLDGRGEDRAQVPTSKAGFYDHFAHVLLEQDYRVIGCYVVPHDQIEWLAAASANRLVRFAQGKALPGAIDITDLLLRAQAGDGLPFTPRRPLPLSSIYDEAPEALEHLPLLHYLRLL